MKIFLSIFILFFFAIEANCQIDCGGLEGKVQDYKGRNISFALVVVYRGGIQVNWDKTNLAGQYRITGIPPGEYTVKTYAVGHAKKCLVNLPIQSGQVWQLNINLPSPHLCFTRRTDMSHLKNRSHPNVQTISRDELQQMGR